MDEALSGDGGSAWSRDPSASGEALCHRLAKSRGGGRKAERCPARGAPQQEVGSSLGAAPCRETGAAEAGISLCSLCS